MRRLWVSWVAGMVGVLGSTRDVAAAPVHTLDLTDRFGMVPAQADERRAIYDDLTVATSLQGLANRDAPNLYLLYVTSVVDGSIETDALWFDRLSDPAIGGGVLDDRPIESLPDIEAALDAYGDRVAGLAVWDPNVPSTVNAAFAAAGADDLIVVAYSDDPTSWYQRLVGTYPVVASLVGDAGETIFLDDQGQGLVPGTNRQTSQSAKADAYVWAIENYLVPGALNPLELGCMLDGRWVTDPTDYGGNPQPTHQLQITNRDWLVAQRGMPFDLSPWGDVAATDDPGQPVGTDPAILVELVSKARAQAPDDVITIRGFFAWQFKYTTLEGLPPGHEPVTGEWTSVQLVSPWAVGLDADAPGVATMANASFHTHVPLPEIVEPQPRPTAEDLVGAGFLTGLANNGGFEDGTAVWTLQTTNRVVYTDDVPGPASAHGGLRWLQCNTADATDPAANGIYRDGPGVAAGQRVTLRAFVRAPAGAVDGELAISATGGTSEQATQAFTAGADWQEVRVTLDVAQAGHTATRGQIVLHTSGTNLDVDDVAFYAGDPESGSVVPANYVMWFIGDYDGSAWLASFTPTTWDREGRGVVPMAWDFSGHLATRFPPLFNHVLATRTPRDYFIGADSGPGYGNPSRLDAHGREIWATAGMRAHRRLDVSTTWVLDPLDTIDATGLSAVTPFAGDGIVFYGQTSVPLPSLVGGTPVMSLSSAGGDSAAAVVASVVAALDPPATPTFSAYRTVLKSNMNTAGGSVQVVEDHPELRARFVGPYELFYLLRHHLGGAIRKRASYVDVQGLRPQPDEPGVLQVTVRNDGWETWSDGFRLGAHLSDDSPRARQLPAQAGSYPIRVELPGPVAPGDSVTLELPMPALAEGESQRVQLDMVEEGVSWFESQGDIPLQVTIVAEATPDDGGDTGGDDGTGGDDSGGDDADAGATDGGDTSGEGDDTDATDSAGAADGSGGCGCRSSTSTRGGPWLALFVLPWLFGWRRRRR